MFDHQFSTSTSGVIMKALLNSFQPSIPTKDSLSGELEDSLTQPSKRALSTKIKENVLPLTSSMNSLTRESNVTSKAQKSIVDSITPKLSVSFAHKSELSSDILVDETHGAKTLNLRATSPQVRSETSTTDIFNNGFTTSLDISDQNLTNVGLNYSSVDEAVAVNNMSGFCHSVSFLSNSVNCLHIIVGTGCLFVCVIFIICSCTVFYHRKQMRTKRKYSFEMEEINSSQMINVSTKYHTL
jgi:hypothetical protein